MIPGWAAFITLLSYPFVCYGIGWVALELVRPALLWVAQMLDVATDIVEAALRP